MELELVKKIKISFDIVSLIENQENPDLDMLNETLGNAFCYLVDLQSIYLEKVNSLMETKIESPLERIEIQDEIVKIFMELEGYHNQLENHFNVMDENIKEDALEMIEIVRDNLTIYQDEIENMKDEIQKESIRNELKKTLKIEEELINQEIKELNEMLKTAKSEEIIQSVEEEYNRFIEENDLEKLNYDELKRSYNVDIDYISLVSRQIEVTKDEEKKAMLKANLEDYKKAMKVSEQKIFLAEIVQHMQKPKKGNSLEKQHLIIMNKVNRMMNKDEFQNLDVSFDILFTSPVLNMLENQSKIKNQITILKDELKSIRNQIKEIPVSLNQNKTTFKEKFNDLTSKIKLKIKSNKEKEIKKETPIITKIISIKPASKKLIENLKKTTKQLSKIKQLPSKLLKSTKTVKAVAGAVVVAVLISAYSATENLKEHQKPQPDIEPSSSSFLEDDDKQTIIESNVNETLEEFNKRIVSLSDIDIEENEVIDENQEIEQDNQIIVENQGVEQDNQIILNNEDIIPAVGDLINIQDSLSSLGKDNNITLMPGNYIVDEVSIFVKNENQEHSNNYDGTNTDMLKSAFLKKGDDYELFAHIKNSDTGDEIGWLNITNGYPNQMFITSSHQIGGHVR